MMIRYRVRKECAEQNEQLVRAVFEELAAARPEGLSYESVVLDDGVTFVHLVEGDSTGLQELSAFQAFAWTVGERCEDPPVQSTVRVVGSYNGRQS
jgi:hypothetical protein